MPQIIGLYNERFVSHKLLDCIMRDLYPTNYWIVKICIPQMIRFVSHKLLGLYLTNYCIMRDLYPTN